MDRSSPSLQSLSNSIFPALRVKKQFFQFHQTPEKERVALVSFHLEGDAQLWCGPTQFQDFFGELAKLQQFGTVRDYQTQFERLLTKVGDNIKANVLAGRPTTLLVVIRLSCLYEAHNFS
ncbi:hypothetical protein AMTRI_Chr07g78300 [Amborella trichopoda]